MKTAILKHLEKFVIGYFESHPDVAAKLKSSDAQQLIAEGLSDHYEVRDGHLVDSRTAVEVASVDAIVRGAARPYLKSLGQGKFIPRWKDNRNENEKNQHTQETRSMLERWILNRNYKFIDNDASRVSLDYLSRSLVYETDGQGGFQLALLRNGVPVKKYPVVDIFNRYLLPYVDNGLTTIAQKRQEVRVRDEALKFAGMTYPDLQDNKKRAVVDSYIELLQKEFEQPTKRKLPNFNDYEVKTELQKESAYHLDFPSDPEVWDLRQKMILQVAGEKLVDEYEREVFSSLDQFQKERTPQFYKTSIERLTGLDYGESEMAYLLND